MAVRSKVRTEPCTFLEGGTPLRLETGPLAGLEGVPIPTHPSRRLAIALTVLKRSISIEIEGDWVVLSAKVTSGTSHAAVK